MKMPSPWRKPVPAPDKAEPHRNLPLGLHPLLDLIRLVGMVADVQRDIVHMARMSFLLSAWACAVAGTAFLMGAFR
jgi:hypothetical protein